MTNNNGSNGNSFESLQNFLYSEDLIEIIRDTSILAKLKDDQTGYLTDTLGDVLLGRISRQEFSQKISSRNDITPSQVNIINNTVNIKVFQKFQKEIEDLEKRKQTNNVLIKEIPNKMVGTEVTTQTAKSSQEPNPIESQYSPGKPLTRSHEEINKPKPLPDLSLPEIQEIKIERPVSKTGELKRVTVPSVSPEAQEKIHSKLMEAMKKKEAKPKIIEELKKVVIEGIKKTTPQKPQPKTIPDEEKPLVSQVTGGENHKFAPQEKTEKSPVQKPYILDVKLKEEEVEKKENFPKEEIKYQKPAAKPFGEA
jgi:hypothetical protein